MGRGRSHFSGPSILRPEVPALRSPVAPGRTPPSPRSSQTGLPTVLAGTGGVGGVGGGVRSGQACCRGAAMFWGGTQDAQAHLIRGYVWGLLKPEGHNLFKTSMCQIVFFVAKQ